MTQPRTLVDKIWDKRVVTEDQGTTAVLAVDLHLVHEVTSPQAFTDLRARGVGVRRPDETVATADQLDADHAVGPRRAARHARDPKPADGRRARRRRRSSSRGECAEFGIPIHSFGATPRASSTSSGRSRAGAAGHDDRVRRQPHGDPRRIRGARLRDRDERGRDGPGDPDAPPAAPEDVRGPRRRTPRPGVGAKDVILALIGRIGIGGGTGHVFEYRGEAIRALSMEQRMTMCNMSIEGGARAGLIAPDDTTFDSRPWPASRPRGGAWDTAVAGWRNLPSDDGATFDKSIGSTRTPSSRWSPGHQPGHGHPRHRPRPSPADARTRSPSRPRVRAEYMDLEPGLAIAGQPVDVVFIGSCTNSRISDLRLAASVLRDRQVHGGGRVMVVRDPSR